MNNDNKTNYKGFLPTLRITTRLLEDLKNGREHLVPGQWLYSPKFKKKVKYIGTFYRNDNGIIKPVVKFSERRDGQTITDWNISFKRARDASLMEERRYKMQLRRQGTINERRDFTRKEAVTNDFIINKQPQQQSTSEPVTPRSDQATGIVFRLKNWIHELSNGSSR